MTRSYTQQTIKLLFGQARECAFPGCQAPLIFTDRGKRTVVAEIAHIRSETADGPATEAGAGRGRSLSLPIGEVDRTTR